MKTALAAIERRYQKIPLQQKIIMSIIAFGVGVLISNIANELMDTAAILAM